MTDMAKLWSPITNSAIFVVINALENVLADELSFFTAIRTATARNPMIAIKNAYAFGPSSIVARRRNWPKKKLALFLLLLFLFFFCLIFLTFLSFFLFISLSTEPRTLHPKPSAGPPSAGRCEGQCLGLAFSRTGKRFGNNPTMLLCGVFGGGTVHFPSSAQKNVTA